MVMLGFLGPKALGWFQWRVVVHVRSGRCDSGIGRQSWRLLGPGSTARAGVKPSGTAHTTARHWG
jgi:hypothetical protein